MHCIDKYSEHTSIICPVSPNGLNRVRGMTIRESQTNRRDKYLEHTSIILPVGANGRVFVDDLSDSGFESKCSH